MTELTENAESPDPSEVGTERPPRDGRTIGLDLLDRFGAAAVAGLAAGFLIGGFGGRMAMLLLRLTSSDSVIGIQSDDDFTIGQVTTSSFFLVLATTLIGTLLAFAYLLVRRWLPEHRRPLQAAVFFGVIGGAAVIKPGGVDFTLLDPLWLAVVLFIALPAAYGWVMAAMVEGLIARPGTYRKTRVAGHRVLRGRRVLRPVRRRHRRGWWPPGPDRATVAGPRRGRHPPRGHLDGADRSPRGRGRAGGRAGERRRRDPLTPSRR